MQRVLLSVLMAVTSVGVVAAPASTMTPFTADYVVLRNGKELGQTTIALSRNADDTWTLRTSTKGTAGMAKMAGLDVDEQSSLRWHDGVLETLAYEYRQQAAFKQRTRQIDVDAKAQRVRMADGDENHEYALVPGLIDRQAVTLALSADLARGAPVLDYKVAGRERVDDVQYVRCGEPEITVPAGAYASTCVERVRDRRVSRSWFAESLGWLPVQIEQVEKKGDNITLKLVSLKR